MTEYSYLGKALPRTHDRDKLSGKSLYTADFHLPGMLWGKILHSPQAHARIANIDISRAQKLKGVKAVVTSADTPGLRMGRWLQDRPVLAEEEVRYKGEPVAAVAAVDPETAEEALDLIRVDYEALPSVFDALLAMEPEAPLVHSSREAYKPTDYRGRGQGNIILEAVVRCGDVEKGLAESAIIHQDRYSTPAEHPGYIEPHAVFAAPDSQGKVTVWSSTKGPFMVRSMTAKILKMPMSKLRVIAPTLGGDFGGKGTAYLEPIVVLLALKSGAPVRLAYTQEEELTSTFVRDAAFMELTMGAKKDGTFLALKGWIVFDSGAYCDLIGNIDQHIFNLVGPYNVPNLELKGYRVYTNNLPRGLVRAPTAPPPAFAIESHIDGLARKIGLDPVAIRLKNGVEDGDVLPYSNLTLRSVGLKQTLQAVQGYLKGEQGVSKKNRGWGVACSQWGVQPVGAREAPPSSAWVKINEDGTVVLLTGATDNGGGQYGIFAQIVAEILKIPPEAVMVIAADTDATPSEQATGGSRTTHRVGHSVRIAAEDALDKLLGLAAETLEAAKDDLTFGDGRVSVKGNPERSLTLAQLASASLTSRRGPIVGIGEKGREEMLAAEAKAGRVADSGVFGTHAVQVEVDPDTGLVKVLKYFAAHDVGFAINPANVAGQIEGGVAFGIGYGLSEELVLREGEVKNPDFLDYKLPTIMNVPQIASTIVEVPARYGPFGAKGVGEPVVVPVAPALANAICDAIGVRITDLPITPEKIFRALHTSEKS